MSRFYSYISTASKIINNYDGSNPLVHYLKNFFALEKKYGSTDRKTIADLCYVYFRVAHAFKKEPVEDIMLAGLFLCSTGNNKILGFLHPQWNEQVTLPVIDKFSLLNLRVTDIFPFAAELSEEINIDDFAVSFLKQPALFTRIRPGRKEIVVNKLSTASIPFQIFGENCLRLANTTSLQDTLKINRDIVIQDFSSQQVFNFFKRFPGCFPVEEKITAWDSCAASGGKSILLYDILKGNVQLTVSDIRQNILANLLSRLQQAGINIYKHFVADLAKKRDASPNENFSIIILDAPCTGSGTWSRNPEQLFYFDKKNIISYQERQKQIASTLVSHLKENGLFFYITCSVFKKENEDVAGYIKDKLQLRLLETEYLKGYNDYADTMFVAVFSK